MKKTLIFIASILLLCACSNANNSSSGTSGTEEKVCEHKCEICHKCQNVYSDEECCLEKCEHLVITKQLAGSYRISDTYTDILHTLYSDGQLLVCEAAVGGSQKNVKIAFGSYAEKENGHTFSITNNRFYNTIGKKFDNTVNYSYYSELTKDNLEMTLYKPVNLSKKFKLLERDTIVNDVDTWISNHFTSETPLETQYLSTGNDALYALDKVEEEENSKIKNKNILFLGSSVVRGEASNKVAIPEYLAKKSGANCVKDAVSGTTLVDQGGSFSYIQRLLKHTNEEQYDLFVLQLSTNDATKELPLGTLSNQAEEYNKNTVIGAIEYILQYVKDTWNCPVLLFSNSYYESEAYQKMVDAAKSIQSKWNFTFLDLYSDEEFNDISLEERFLYIDDDIHPYKAGYLLWWLPKFEEAIYQII